MIDASELADRQQMGLLRLQLFITGETHRRLAGWLAEARSTLLAAAGTDGSVPITRANGLADELGRSLGEVLREWTTLLERARLEAAAIPLGALVALHNGYAGLVIEERATHGVDRAGWPTGADAVQRTRVTERIEVLGDGIPVFEPPLREIVDATAQRVYGDGLVLSDRLWNLERRSSQELRNRLAQMLVTGESAFDAAAELEQFLGANARCPRWSDVRLYGLTPAERINSEAGLFGGSPCESEGVAYNALRLARNEIQTVHHEASRMLLRRQPWVEGEFIQLSPNHPVRDICDDYAEGGPYAIGEVPLPIHVQCMCYAVADLMPEDLFVGRMRGWLTGDEAWDGMDAYAAWIGSRELSPIPEALGQALEQWAAGNADELDARLMRDDDAVLWYELGDGLPVPGPTPE